MKGGYVMTLPVKPTEETQNFDKAIRMAKYYLFPFKKRTLADVAAQFNCSSSTVGRYLKIVLPKCNPKLAEKVAAKSAKVQMQNRAAFTKMMKKN